MVLPDNLFFEIALADKSGRTNWLLVSAIKSYSEYVRKNKGVREKLIVGFLRLGQCVVTLGGSEVVVFYLPNRLLHGELHGPQVENSVIPNEFSFGRIIKWHKQPCYFEYDTCSQFYFDPGPPAGVCRVPLDNKKT